jgi:Rieske Fe-S protein
VKSCGVEAQPPADVHRRRFLSRIVLAIQGTIGAAVAFVAGGAALGPALTTPQSDWWPAGNASDLLEGEPTPVTIRRTVQDGYTQTIDRQVVFVVKTESGQIIALSATCTHLGCRVRWDADAELLKCPCHGGTFDRTGAVKSGPPPAPLVRLATRVDGDQVQVQL